MANKSTKKDSSATAQTPAPAATPDGFDSELDAIFKAAPPAPLPAVTARSTSTSTAAASGPSNSRKRKAAQQQLEQVAQEDSEQEESNEEAEHDDNDDNDDNDNVEMEQGHGDLSSVDEELDDEGSLLFSQSEAEDDSDNQDDAEAPEEDEPYVPPQHESVIRGRGKNNTTEAPAKQRKKTFKQEHEPSETRDQRTLFIGNVPIETAQSRSLQRKLTSFIESFSPYPILTKATALRFRSVPFATPTVNLDADADDDDDASGKKKNKKNKNKGKSNDRSQNYKEAVAAVEGGLGSQAPLTAQQKRKIAFINQDFHEKAKSVSAYLTIAHPQAVLDHLYDIAPPKAKSKDAAQASTRRIELDCRLTGYILAALIAPFADGQPFEGRHLRVDLVKSISPGQVLTSGLEKVKTLDGNLAGSSNATTDPKSTLFVGGLDFETDEEEVRAFFESLLVEELGPAGEAITIPVTGLDGKRAPKDLLDSLSREFPFVPPEQRKPTESVVRDAEYVRSVRLIRDAATQMGKGIGYVRFASQQCVDEVMAIYNADQALLESIKGVKGSLGASAAIAAGGKELKRRLKLKGRPIRVAYCKSQTNDSPHPRSKKHSNAEEDQAEPGTPQRKSPRYERSSGAPTPNGTSPHALQKKRQRTMPPTKISPGSPSASRAPPANSADIAKKADLYATLSKDERKQLKKEDQDRINRRMEKKNKKFPASAKGAFKADKSLLAEGDKVKSKEKVRLRQPNGAGAKGVGGGNKFNKAPPQVGARRGPPKAK
ncbi:hypothetical protein NDA14_007790 [Ustilago hordei]|uniref:RRM domain-containing protein n=1 Tax=Ustilago hordei TaxID=120017 RepID=I2FSH4_USTHO|nr:uncharacterized protein UHO2_05737 [Ustilago hordei]KAJ1042083.1 hypothetical protein NDA10_008066 [Ustilago hordei]KAJ1573395.1 hypothetical protein NDA15_007265 [Ustilago hordei]KAJ1574783.1 hypothetical protein NDA12_004243 [Ustilago hordei]KAJ1596423.1 hypothetical protein NDA14_007790 [Ustilago hordei]CCF49867.1 uncharacterized protein UHOR_08229 [Ustilago hordei]